MDNPNVTLKAVSTLNPATLFPTNIEEPMHDCIQIIAQGYSSHLDLMDQPLEDPVLEMFTDGSSFMDQEQCKAGCAMVTHPKDTGSRSPSPMYLLTKGGTYSPDESPPIQVKIRE